ncbi:MAG: helix-turn-helix domain-containing protein, partial [Rubrivivax sp.]
MNPIDPKALFRLSVLGPLVSRERLARGELQQLIGELCMREYAIPGTQRRHVGRKTIEAWYYAWRREGLQGLVPKPRADRGTSRLSPALQEAVLQAKRDNPQRSVRQILRVPPTAALAARAARPRSAAPRRLQRHEHSARPAPTGPAREQRSFNAEFAGSIWYGDVMHGPAIMHQGRLRKTYLV